jgi:hypothetical protein
MISIIICSVSSDLADCLSENIKKTIGTEYELLIENNSGSDKGICHVYNKLAQQAKYEYILFIHEDICFHTLNWGSKLIALLSRMEIGLVGVSGSVYKSSYSSSWTACKQAFYRMNTIQHYIGVKNPFHHVINPDQNSYSEVALIDGVFMATRSDVFTKFRFDDILLKGFHGYDFDLCMQIRSNYKIVVTHDIQIEHFSSGTINEKWLDDIVLLHKKWKNHLPIYIGKDNKNDYESDYIAASSLFDKMLTYHSELFQVMKYYIVILTYFFPLNKFKFTKSFVRYLFTNS